MPITDDPVADFERHDREQAEWLSKLPTCQICGDAIQQERCLNLGGFRFCNECIENHMEVIESFD